MSKSAASKSIIPILILLVLLIGTGYLLSNFLFPTRTLPVFNPIDVHPDLVDATVADVAENHKIASFSVFNQNGENITQADYKDKIYVANSFLRVAKPFVCP